MAWSGEACTSEAFPADVVGAIAAALRLPLAVDHAVSGGQGRTFFAVLTGEPVVVKWAPSADLPDKIPYVAAQAAELGRRGCRIPRIIAHGAIGSGNYAWVQERLPGDPATLLDDTLLTQLVALIRRLAGAPPGWHRNSMAYWVPAVVFDDEAGWWQVAAGMGQRAAGFCRRLAAFAGNERPAARHDYVHSDLNPGNVLQAGGRITGLVDVEDLGVGDRGIDVARLAFEWFRVAQGACKDDGSPSLPDDASSSLLAPNGLETLLGLGHEVTTETGWRVAIGYELISRLGWRSDLGVQYDYARLLPLCEDFLDAVS